MLLCNRVVLGLCVLFDTENRRLTPQPSIVNDTLPSLCVGKPALGSFRETKPQPRALVHFARNSNSNSNAWATNSGKVRTLHATLFILAAVSYLSAAESRTQPRNFSPSVKLPWRRKLARGANEA